MEWSHPTEGWWGRIQWPFVALTWLLATILATITSVALGMLVLSLVEDGAVGETGRSAMHISAAVMTLLSFVAVLLWRLPHLKGDRLLNSLAVAATHTIVAAVVLAVAMIVQGTASPVPIPGNTSDELALIALALERTAVIAVLACILVPGIIPARGDVPAGTQAGVEPTDRQL